MPAPVVHFEIVAENTEPLWGCYRYVFDWQIQVDHINGIENFWNQSKRHLRGYNGIPRRHFPLFIKECEWRFNYRPVTNLTKVMQTWWFK